MSASKTTQVSRKKNILKSSMDRKCAAPFADKIPFIRSLILDSVRPGTIKKIYLFGSYAYGKPTRKSDIDLCVVIRNRLHDSRAYLKIAMNLFDNDIIPVDLLVYREKQFKNIKNPNGIENTISTKGKLLYE